MGIKFTQDGKWENQTQNTHKTPWMCNLKSGCSEVGYRVPGLRSNDWQDAQGFCYFICTLFAWVYSVCNNLLNYSLRIGPFSCISVYSRLYRGHQKNMPMSLFPEPYMTKELIILNLAKEVIKLRLLRGGAHPGLPSWALIWNEIVLRDRRTCRDTERGGWRQRQRLEWCWHEPEAGRGRQVLPQSL